MRTPLNLAIVIAFCVGWNIEEGQPGYSHKFTDCAQRIKLEGLKLHSSRHTFGIYMISLGYDITVMKELLGHEDIKSTLVYA